MLCWEKKKKKKEVRVKIFRDEMKFLNKKVIRSLVFLRQKASWVSL